MMGSNTTPTVPLHLTIGEKQSVVKQTFNIAEFKAPMTPIFIAILCVLYVIVLCSTYSTHWFQHVFVCVILSVGSFYCTFRLVPLFAITLKNKGLFGKDLNKLDQEYTIPEALGLVSGSVFIICAMSCQLLFSADPAKLLEYNSGLLAVCCMTFLGFVDDVLDLRWRYKMILPMFAAFPLVVTYRGPTTIIIPGPLQSWFHINELFDLGLFYHLYIISLTVFCTNSINIYAGINGLEVGQSLVMSGAVIAHNLLSLTSYPENHVFNFRNTFEKTLYLNHHFFSLLFSLPFFSCSLSLLCFNWYPSSIFVGDTYTYFAGMYFAVVGILGHFSKTLLFFFIPQILNFLMSLPQLLGVIPCPRHRVPRIQPKTGKLQPTLNYTLLNLTLRIVGPLSEEALCTVLLCFQVICCIISLYVRHWLIA